MSSHLPPGGHCERHELQLDEIIESFGSGIDSAKRAAPNASMPSSYTPFFFQPLSPYVSARVYRLVFVRAHAYIYIFIYVYNC